MTARRSVSLILALTLVLTVVPASVAEAFRADFFAKDTSGQAVYEDMAIKPQAVYMDGVTYIVYQGWLNDPYITAYDHETKRWDGPYKIGDNPLNESSNPLNTHGAPALYADPATKRLHVFWGGHGHTAIWYANTTAVSSNGRPRIREADWSVRTRIRGGATYPQVVSYEVTHGPQVELFFRVPNSLGWASRVTTPGALPDIGKMSDTPALVGTVNAGTDRWGWYATFDADSSGRVHMAALAQEHRSSSSNPTDPFDREGIYYAYRNPGETRWYNIKDEPIEMSGKAPNRSELRAGDALVFEKTGTAQNQVSIAVDADGKPAIIFLTGTKHAMGRGSQEWTFARWDDAADDGNGEWIPTSIDKTDHFFDAGALDFPDGEDTDHVEAFLVTGGTAGESWASNRYLDRGGDIVRYTSRDNGETWEKVPVRSADLARGEIYNDPQIVRAATPGDPSFRGKSRLLFCQWDNDADNFINKVFLWGESSGFAQKEFLPELHRLWGATRIETAVNVSKESFPLGPPRVPPAPADKVRRTVFVTTGENFADALSGVPLAHASRAPMLFVTGQTLSPAVAAELKRLRGADTRHRLDVVILGGTAAVAAPIETALRNHPDTGTVRRIDGRDRYEVSRKIALELADKTGGAFDGVFVASGESFPDALAAAPVAAAKGYPILLTNSDTLNSHTRSVLSQFQPEAAIVVGGPKAIDPAVVESIESRIPGGARRVQGSDRYETAVAVATMGLRGVHGDQGVLSMDRFIVASGEMFPDALAGGAFAARLRGPVILTRQSSVPESTRGFLRQDAVEVLDAHVVGGPAAVSPLAYQQVADILQANKNEKRERR